MASLGKGSVPCAKRGALLDVNGEEMVEVHGRAARLCGRGGRSAGVHGELHGAAGHLRAGAGEAVVPGGGPP
eukprot:15778576-Heterocapsa_arctica.AAC.1